MPATRKSFVLVPLAVLICLLLWMVLRTREEPVGNQSEQASSRSETDSGSVTLKETSPGGVAINPDLHSRLLGELELLQSVNGEAVAQARLQSMFAWLESVSAKEASAAIVSVLQSREDAFTFGRFSPGQDGFLKSYPTFRTALLDELEKLDPSQAVEMSKEILNTSANPDEWALSLRTLAKHGSSSADQFVFNEKVEALLVMKEWLEDPSFSFLHAFDAAVVNGEPKTIERLGALVSEPVNRAVSHAATLSVDRFFQMHSSVGLSYVAEHPEFLEDATGFRASLVARADPENVSEMNAVETYLENGATSLKEKQTFFLSFPNFNSTFSYNLVTGSLLLPRMEMRQRSLAAMAHMENWLRDNRYPEFEDDLNQAISRLAKTWKVEL